MAIANSLLFNVDWEKGYLSFLYPPVQDNLGVDGANIMCHRERGAGRDIMGQSLSGGCLCGFVRYNAIPKENAAYYCHCRDCQIGSASAFTVAIFSDEQSFRITSGEVATYATVADSGRKLERKFCQKCGTPLIWTGEGFPGTVLISLSSLDDPEAFQPVHEGWTDSAVSWSRISADVQSFPGRPVRG